VRMRGIRTRAGALISAEVVKLVPRKDSERHSPGANSFVAKSARENIRKIRHLHARVSVG